MHSKNLKSPFDEESACIFWKEFYYDEFMSGRLDFDAIVADSKIVSSILSINSKSSFLITNGVVLQSTPLAALIALSKIPVFVKS